MRFIAGPRQTGKTTLSKSFLVQKGSASLYVNWDMREIRAQYKQDPYFFETMVRDARQSKKMPWVCCDEIHKMPKWKDILKDYFDRYEKVCRFIVTGSARLDLFRKSGDSLAGRYFLFHLFPLSLSEVAVTSAPHITPKQSARDFVNARIANVRYEQDAMEHLLEYSGFPEPFTKARHAFYVQWERDMMDRIIREDIRDITKIVELEHIATVMQLLPERIGSLLSLNALKDDVGVSYNGVKNYISALEKTYAIFLVPPYSKRITRSIKKEKKCYFFDWTRCATPAQRFENYVAMELNATVSLWNDRGVGNFELCFIRTKDGHETDFLITKDAVPWCLFEAKLQDGTIEGHHYRHAAYLNNIPLIQLTHQNNVMRKDSPSFFRVSASRFFA